MLIAGFISRRQRPPINTVSDLSSKRFAVTFSLDGRADGHSTGLSRAVVLYPRAVDSSPGSYIIQAIGFTFVAVSLTQAINRASAKVMMFNPFQ